MQNKRFRFGPIALTTSVANLLNPPTATGGVNGGSSAQYIVLNHVRIVNKHASATGKASIWVGATGASAAGTETMFSNTPIAVGSYADWYGAIRLDSSDFLTGTSDTATCLTIEGEGEIGVSG